MSTPPMTPITRSHTSQQVPTRAYGSFVLNGATDPSVVGGAVASVRRLVTSTPTIFFRVKLDASYKIDDLATTIQLTAEAVDESDDLTVMLADLTADPVASKDAFREIDILVRDGGVAVDTAGIKIHINLSVNA